MSELVVIPRDEVERIIKVLRYAAHPQPSPHADWLEDRISRAQPAPGATQPSAKPAAWMHDDPMRVDVIHSEVKSLLQKAGAHLHRPLDKTERYTIPLYTHPSPADEAVRLLSDIKAWDVSQFLALPQHLRARIQAVLAQRGEVDDDRPSDI